MSATKPVPTPVKWSDSPIFAREGAVSPLPRKGKGIAIRPLIFGTPQK